MKYGPVQFRKWPWKMTPRGWKWTLPRGAILDEWSEVLDKLLNRPGGSVMGAMVEQEKGAFVTYFNREWVLQNANLNYSMKPPKPYTVVE